MGSRGIVEGFAGDLHMMVIADKTRRLRNLPQRRLQLLDAVAIMIAIKISAAIQPDIGREKNAVLLFQLLDAFGIDGHLPCQFIDSRDYRVKKPIARLMVDVEYNEGDGVDD